MNEVWIIVPHDYDFYDFFCDGYYSSKENAMKAVDEAFDLINSCGVFPLFRESVITENDEEFVIYEFKPHNILNVNILDISVMKMGKIK